MAIFPNTRLRVVARMQLDTGTVVENVYHLVTSGSDQCTDSAALSAIEAWLAGAMSRLTAHMPTALDALDITVDEVTFSGGRWVTVRTLGTIPWTNWAGGSSSAEALPSGTAGVVTFSTAVPGVQGRKFLGPFTETVQAAGVWTSTVLAALALYAGDILSGTSAGTITFGSAVMSTKVGNSVALLAGVVRAIVGYQRRRKTGVGV